MSKRRDRIENLENIVESQRIRLQAWAEHDERQRKRIELLEAQVTEQAALGAVWKRRAEGEGLESDPTARRG